MTPPVTYLHDGSFDGLLSAVAKAVKAGLPIEGVFAAQHHVARLFETVVTVETAEEQAMRLFSYLRQLGGDAARFAMNGYLSEAREVGLHLCRMVQLCLVHGGLATSYYSDASIRFLAQGSRRVAGEAHRLYGLVRFRILAENLQYGPFEAECNVIGYLAHHFRDRLHNRHWILHDLGRNVALHWDGQELTNIDIDPGFAEHVRRHGEVPAEHLDGDERYYQELWQSFHRTIALPGRENRRLQRQLMPGRYWKYLIETGE